MNNGRIIKALMVMACVFTTSRSLAVEEGVFFNPIPHVKMENVKEIHLCQQENPYDGSILISEAVITNQAFVSTFHSTLSNSLNEPYRGPSAGTWSLQVFVGQTNEVLSVVYVLGGAMGYTIWIGPNEKWEYNENEKTFLRTNPRTSLSIKLQNIHYFKHVVNMSKIHHLEAFNHYDRNLKQFRKWDRANIQKWVEEENPDFNMDDYVYYGCGSLDEVIRRGETMLGPVQQEE